MPRRCSPRCIRRRPLPTIGDTFGVTPSRAGLTISVLVLALVVGAWIWGPIAARIGRRRSLLAACALQVPATFAVALAPTFELLLAARVLQGLIMPGILVVGLPYVAQVFVPAIGVRAVGWYTAALIVGGLVGRLGVAFMTSFIGWRGALAVLALLPLIALVVMTRSLPAAAAHTRTAETGRLLARAATLTGRGVLRRRSLHVHRVPAEAEPFSLSPTGVVRVPRVGRVVPPPRYAVGAVRMGAGRSRGRHAAVGVAVTRRCAPPDRHRPGPHLRHVRRRHHRPDRSARRPAWAGAASSLYYWSTTEPDRSALPGLAWQAFGWQGWRPPAASPSSSSIGVGIGMSDGGTPGRAAGQVRVRRVATRHRLIAGGGACRPAWDATAHLALGSAGTASV